MVVMDVKQTTEDYVSKYIDLLNKLHNDTNALAPLKVSILHNHISQSNENKSSNMENHCQYCWTSWKHGNLVLKTCSKYQNKINKLQKKRTPMKYLFTMVVKCKVCSNTTNSVLKKNKIFNHKLNEKLSKKSTVVKNVSETPIVQKNAIESTEKRKSKKKKRNLYAGLNPLVFKDREIHKTKLKKLKRFTVD